MINLLITLTKKTDWDKNTHNLDIRVPGDITENWVRLKTSGTAKGAWSLVLSRLIFHDRSPAENACIMAPKLLME
jgi:hypothetical protein